MLLGFREPAKLKTKKIIFEEVFHACDACTLEQLKELSGRRKVIEESINKSSLITEAIAREIAGGLTSQNQQDMQKLDHYLPLLENLVLHIELLNDSVMSSWIYKLKIRWSSPLSASCGLTLGGEKFFHINSLRFELGMHLFLYGAILRERAFETQSTDLVESSTLFRKAAGVYNYLAQTVLPPLQPSLPVERPPEATSSMSSIMSIICLADAQAVIVQKAEEKGSSANLLSKLHYGVIQILDEASCILKSRTRSWNHVSKRLMEMISTCSILHQLRSQRHLAKELISKDQIGTAIAVLRYAKANAKKVKAPRDGSWCTIFNQEINDLGGMLKKSEHENEFMWFQKIPSADSLPVLQGQIIANAIPYDPQKYEKGLLFNLRI